jgi:hypothetical protein
MATLVGAVLVVVLAPAPSPVDAAGTGEGIKLVAEVPFLNGSHQVFTTIRGRDYAFVSELNGLLSQLRVIDVTNPTNPKVVATSPCTGYQGNVQVSHDKKTLVVGIDDDLGGGGSGTKTSCPVAGKTGVGFITIDISDPTHPKPVGFADIPKGSHSLATHPTKPFVYNGEGFPEAPGRMQVWSIKNPARPKLVNTLDTGVHSPHDLAFNKTGDMAATANVVNLHLLDTSDPANPKIVHTTQCPGCLHTHEARFTPDGKRLVVNDEYPIPAPCPGGLMYFYDITHKGSSYGLDLTGTYTIGDRVTNSHGDVPTLCTPHIFDISSDGTRIASSWHEGGLRYLDITESAGVTAGAQQTVPGGVTEVGYYSNPGGDAFSAKIYKGYIYLVDLTVGLQIFKI